MKILNFFYFSFFCFSLLHSREVQVIFEKEPLQRVFLEDIFYPVVCHHQSLSMENLGPHPVFQLNLIVNHRSVLPQERQFSLYPNEKVTYRNSQTEEVFLSVAHEISLGERGGNFTYDSAFPISSILNFSETEVLINGEIVKANEERLIEESGLFTLQVMSRNCEEKLLICSQGAHQELPSLIRGNNLLELGMDDNPSTIEVTFFDEEQEEEKRIVVSHTPEFFHIKTTLTHGDQLWWQISEFSDFDLLIREFDQVHDFRENVEITPQMKNLLKGENYFFRCKVRTKEGWSNWSPVYPFHVSCAPPVQNILLRRLDDQQIEMSWDPIDPHASYLIFGSNNQDFIPEIYFHQHLLHMQDNEKTDWLSNQNLIGETTKTSLLMGSSLSYYKIVAVQQGRYGEPSELIDLNQLFPTLPLVPEEGWETVRPYLLPESYPIKKELDRLFSESRITKENETLIAAGFELMKSSDPHVIACKHPNLKGFVIYMHRDTSPMKNEGLKWIDHIVKGESIQHVINKKGYKNIFKVPKKWLYPWPSESDLSQKNFLMVVREMKLLSQKENDKKYRTETNRKLLEKLFLVIEEVGLLEDVRANHLVWSKDGRLAFVDAVFFPPDTLFEEWLSLAHRGYWKSLTSKAK